MIKEALRKHTVHLVEIASETGDETAITNDLECWAQRLVDDKKLPQDAITRHENCLVLGKPDVTRLNLALVGHTDTVPKEKNYAGVKWDGVDKIVGLGVSDMKCSLGVMQVLYETLPLEQLPINLLLIFYDKEEGPYGDNGLQPLLESYDWLQRIDLAIAMEPTDNTLQLGCLGGIQAEINWYGKAAHSARPWQGANAIHGAGETLMRLHNRVIPEVIIDGLRFKEPMSATLASGGRARNVVPDQFTINLNYRFAPTTPIEARIEQAIEEIKSIAIGAEVLIKDISPPGPIPHNNSLLEQFKSSSSLMVEPKQAWTDVARLATFGIDAVNYGPGFGDQAHQKGEWASLKMITESYHVLENFVRGGVGR